MTGEQIKLEIEKKNRQIREMIMPSFFSLNNGVQVLMNEIKDLQSQCPHNYEDGFCVYCNKIESQEDE